jgi:hypothetical protein
MPFVISNAKRLDRGSLIGSFDVELPSGMIIRGAMLFEKNNSRWIGLPCREYVKNDGTRGFSPILEFRDREVSDKWRDLLMPHVIAAFEALEPPPPAKQAPSPAFDDTIPF